MLLIIWTPPASVPRVRGDEPHEHDQTHGLVMCYLSSITHRAGCVVNLVKIAAPATHSARIAHDGPPVLREPASLTRQAPIFSKVQADEPGV